MSETAVPEAPQNGSSSTDFLEQHTQNVGNVKHNKWLDISTETYREYTFPGGDKIRIHDPLRLMVSESHSHRIVDSDGNGHYVPSGWIHIKWKNKEGFEPVNW